MSDEPDYFTIRTALLYDEAGKVVGHRTQGIYFTEQEIARGERMLIVDRAYDDEAVRKRSFVDLSSGDPVIKDRPVLAQTFDRPTLPVRQEATLENVPACRVTFVGPVSGTHDHPGGDLEVGFTVPGDYLISFEAFPNLPCTHQLTVTP